MFRALSKKNWRLVRASRQQTKPSREEHQVSDPTHTGGV